MQYWSISSIVLADEAEKLGLDVEIIVPEKNFFRISGNGRTHFFKSTDFGGNTSLGMKITEDKELTYRMLERGNYPIAKSVYVKHSDFESFNETSVAGLRFPLVIKPHNQAHGNGVMMNISDFGELYAKLAVSIEQYPIIIVQEQISGDEFRVLVVKDEVVVAINRIPPFVIGDGKTTLLGLVEAENMENPLRGNDYERPLSYIRIDSELDHCVKQYGYSRTSVPSKGQKVILRSNSNLGTGATVRDVTALIHPEIRAACIRACQDIGLAIAGVDIITDDISKPLGETGGIILEINDTPGIGGHRELTSVNSGKRILEKLFFE